MVSAWLYFYPPLFTGKFFYSFLAALFLVFVTPPFAGSQIIVPVAAGLIVFLVLGVKNLVFFNRHSLHLLAHSLTLVWLALIFFFGGFWGWWSLLIFFLLVWLLAGEYLTIRNSNEETVTPLVRLTAVTVAFLSAELAWIISLLPIGFIEEAALLAAMVFLIEDVCFYAINGVLDGKLAVRDSVLAAAFIAFVFFLSNWTLH